MPRLLIYLDLCCYKRAFDDQSDPRIRREAENVAVLIEAAEAGKVRLVSSPALILENERNPREDRRLAASAWLDHCTQFIAHSGRIETRADELKRVGFRPLDAYHLAYAETSRARYFVTVDQHIRRRARRLGEKVRLEVVSPGMCRSTLKE